MNRMLVIGIGSLIMTDDGIGVRVAKSIQGKLQEHDVSVLIGETDVNYCLNEIRPDDFIIIMDAVMPGNDPGSIELVTLRDAVKGHGRLHSQHDFSLINAVSLNYPDIQGYLIGIEAVEIGFGFDLSIALEERFNRICDHVFNTVVEMVEAMRYA